MRYGLIRGQLVHMLTRPCSSITAGLLCVGSNRAKPWVRGEVGARCVRAGGEYQDQDTEILELSGSG